jgi:hypothetical protein
MKKNIMVLLAYCCGMLFLNTVTNAATLNFENAKKDYKVSFSNTKGVTDTALKITYAKDKIAYLLPLDANKKKFTELKSCELSKNVLAAYYYSEANGMVFYKFTFGEDNAYIEATCSSPDSYLQLSLDADVVVIPDQITDDEFFFPNNSPDSIRIPGDNHFFVELLDRGNALLTCVWDHPEQEVHVSKNSKSFDKVTFACRRGSSVWFNFTSMNNIWYKTAKPLGSNYTTIDWMPPFTAMWHMLFKRVKGRLPIEDGLGDMWVLLTRDQKSPRAYWGTSLFQPKQMRANVGVLGPLDYPCFVEKGKTHLRLPLFIIPKSKHITYVNNASVIYPFSAKLIYKNTYLKDARKDILLPLDAACVFLGEKQIENLYIRFSGRNISPPTCDGTYAIEKIFYKGNESIKKSANYIRILLDRTTCFVFIINTQILENVKFSQKLISWLNNRKKLYPHLAPIIDEYIKQLSQVEQYYLSRKEKIKTPAYFCTLAKQMDDLINAKYDDEEKEKRCKEIGRQMRTLGGTQDGASTLQRMYLKAIRQQVNLALFKATDHDEIMLYRKLRGELRDKLRIRGIFEGK